MVKRYFKLLAAFLVVALFALGSNGCGGCAGGPSDTVKPSVAISSPEDGSTVSGIVQITASASDNVAVAKVEFYIDGEKKGEDTTSPYEYSWNTDIIPYNVYDKQHTIQAKAYDNAGNVGESPVITVKIGDPQAPQVTITNPRNGSSVKGTVTIKASAQDRSKKTKAPSGIQKVEFYIDGEKKGEDDSPEDGWTYEWVTSSLTSGSTHTIQAKAYDQAGNVGESPEITVTVDNERPNVSILYPADGSTVSGTVQITASASDNVGVAKVEFYDYDVANNVTTKIGEDTQAPYECSWNTDALRYGSWHGIRAVAYDLAGNYNVVLIIVTIGDTQAPLVTITDPQNGSFVKGTVTLKASAQDRSKTKAPSGIQKVEFYYVVNNVATKIGEDNSPDGGWTCNYNTTSVSDGPYTIKAKAYDNAGNPGESPTITVTVDNTKPRVSIFSPATDSTEVYGIVPIKATATDDTAGVAKVVFYLDSVNDNNKIGEDTTPDAGNVYTCNWNTSSVSNGSHTIIAVAHDKAGNVEQSTRAVEVNNP